MTQTGFEEYLSSALGYLRGAQRTGDHVWARFAMADAQQALQRATSSDQRAAANTIIGTVEGWLS
jgi:hypothetical protein